ncbi:hypothetical protein AM493_20275 [Flavobacterium akiainvivens]|uniref:Lipoprotein n=1 Tax=Flavobacterium akiainvivens TaxID=1202724 RepID=A0A0N0RR52_9FLAO|nr:hypothetical protein [Flavobacterium akiainvivens]KOS08122.1 hypothetical protein AM493_20275 [Flavobacterium akiainvivens]SFQ72087.1 hypothetical protein SAMN05444144_11763 [Flavobacterium akiainvivens]
MKTTVHFAVLLAVSALLVCCSGEPAFLKKFTPRDVKRKLYTEKITPADLDILLATNEVNQPVFNKNHEYYYGFYKPLGNNHYLISYKDTYTPAYRFTHFLIGWADVYYCIYNAGTNTVVSKLKVQSSDPVHNHFEEKNGVYTIKSYYHNFNYIDRPCNDIVLKNDSLIMLYKIQDNRFVQVKQ